MGLFALPGKKPSSPGLLFGVTIPSAVGLLFGLALVARGCIGGHSRPHGHGDISFGLSPSGDSLVFNAVGDGGRDLFLLDLETSRVTRLAATPDYEVDPEFSPDGKSIVYAAGKPGDRADHLFVRSRDGKTAKQLTAENANDASPAFSPDGSSIVFTRDKTYNWGGLASNWDAGGVLCVMKADGTGLRQLTADGTLAIDPRFSPDGQTIVFQAEEGLMTMNADGATPPRPLGIPGGSSPSFSPDGQSIVYSSGRFAPDCRIYLNRIDGTRRRKLPSPPGEDRKRPGGGCFSPSFTPDGRRILFFVESWPTGATGVPKENLYEIDLEGEVSREIADYGLFDDPMTWQPKARNPAGPPR